MLSFCTPSNHLDAPISLQSAASCGSFRLFDVTSCWLAEDLRIQNLVQHIGNECHEAFCKKYISVLQMYVTLMFRAKGTRLTKPTLCLVLLSLAVLVGVIRVTEHRNHWNDVLAGFVTGGAIAAFLVRMRRGDGGRKEGGRRKGKASEREDEWI